MFNAADNNLYVADYGANNVRKVTPLGVASTFAGGFSRPYGLALDTVGNLYVAVCGAGTVSKVTPGGSISTFASGFSSPVGLTIDTGGDLYLANFMGTTVSKVTLTAPTVTTPTNAGTASTAGTTATLGGNVTSDGGATITARGVVCSVTATNPNPKLSDVDATNVVGTGTTGAFTVSATGLTAGTGYSYAAYATNSRGTTYSPVGTFTPLSTDATLSALALSAGTLAPAFAAGTTSYLASVASGTASLTVTPTATQANARITVNGTTVAVSGTIALNVGANLITTIVTAQDGTMTKTYTVTVTRMTTVDFISRQTPSASVTNAAAVTYRVTFGTAVSGVTTGNFDLSPAPTGSSVSSVTAIGGAPATQWDVAVSPGAGDGVLTLRLANASGLSIPVSTTLPFVDQSYTIDKTAPTNTVATAAFSADTGASSTDFVTQTAAQTISGTLDAVLMAGESVEVSLDNGTTWATSTTSVGANTWSLAAWTLTASNTLKVRVADTVGNTGPGFQQSYVLDTTAPTIAIGPPSVALAAGGPITVTVTYADAHFHASTLAAGDITLNATGGASATIAVSGTGATRTITLSGLTGNGTLGISIAAGTASDIAGNLAAASSASSTVTIDNTAPTLSTIQRQAPAAVNTAAAGVTYRVTFSEAVTGVDAADFALAVVSGTPSGTIGTVTSVSTSVYDVAVGSLTGQGRLRLELKAGGTGIADLAGNAIGGGFTTGDFYSIGVTNVFDSVSLAAGAACDVSNATAAKVAQRFTTSPAGPLTLVTAVAAIGAVTGTPIPAATVHADNSGVPGATVIATLTNPASLTANVLNTWTGRALLSAGTTYWIVFSDTSAAGAYEMKATAATTGGSGDWLTNSDYAYRSGANAATGPQAGALRLALGANNVPAITSSLAVSATYGSAIGTYTITATHSPTSYNATGLPAGLSVDTNSGQITGTPTTTAGSPFSITLSATNGDGTDTATLVLTVAKAALTVTGVTASDKTYDGATTATLATGSAAVVGLVNGDTPATVVLATGGATGAFADRHAGPGKTVAVVGLSISGTSATHYNLTQPTTTATITAKALTASGLAASDKVYNGTTAAILTGAAALPMAEAPGAGTASDGIPYAGDLVALGGTAAGAFADRHVGTTKAVTVTGLTLSGAESTNYSLAQPAGLTATITAKALTVSGLAASAKVYDGTTAAALTGTAALQTAEAAGAGNTSDGLPYTGDIVSLAGTVHGAFADRHAGSGKAVTVVGLSLTGAQAANYSLTQPSDLSAHIAVKTLTLSGLTATKVYDGLFTAPVTGTAALQTAQAPGTGTAGDGKPYTGDIINITGTPGGTYADKDAATGKIVTVSGLLLDNPNYTLGTPTTTGDIIPKALTVTGVSAVATRIYDGTTVANLLGAPVLLATEAAGAGNASDGKPYDVDSVNTGGTAAGAFADRHVGPGKAIAVTGITIVGTGSGNYTATQPIGLTADVTAKALNVSGVSAVATRIYDGTTAAGLTGTASLLATEAAGSGTTGDGKPYVVDSLSLGGAATGTFADRNVASNKVITVTGLTLGRTDAANYSLVQPAGLTGAVTAKALTVAGLGGGTRVYDATLTAPLTGTATLLAAEPAGAGGPGDGKPYTVDSVSLGGTAAGAFVDRHADTGKAITVTGLTLASTDAGNYTVTPPAGLTGIVTLKALTVSGVTASAKVYDATVAATLTGTAALQSTEAAGDGTAADGKPYAGDTVSLTGTMSGAFADRHAATGKTVTVSGLSLTGAEAANYSVVALTATADITAKPLTIGGVTASNKIYDATTTAPLGGTAALAPAEAVGAGSTGDGLPYDLDTVNIATTASGVFADKDAGTLKAITVSGLALGGAQAANYSPTQPTGLTADVMAKALIVSGLTADHRIYDGTTVATLSGTAVLATAQAPGAGTTFDGQPYTGDALSLSGTAAGAFADRHVASAKAVTVSGLTLSGAQSANYALTPLTGLTADVTVKMLTTSGVASPGKIYDGTTVAPLSGALALQTAQAPGTGTTADGKPYTGDTVNVGGTASGAFADRHVGPAKAIAVTGLTLSGSQASNYSVTPPAGVTAPVTAKAITLIGVTGTHRIYDATTTATLTGTAALQTAETAGTGTAADGKPYTGDALSLGGTPTATFATKTVGTAKPITVTGYTLGDAQAGDYTLTQPAGLTANVTAKALTVSGAIANSKAYDGNTAASLTLTGATLVGVMTADAVTLVTSGATGTFASTYAAAGQTVTIAGLALGGADALNYTLTQPAPTANITPASVQVVLGSLSHVYDGSPKSASATATPSVPVSVSYGGGTAPTNAGSYSVSATVIDSNYTGTANGTLVIAKATQTVNFTAPGSATIGAPLTLSATASSGLPVTFSVVSGSASLAGSALTVDTAGSVTVRASQAGNGNFLPASADRTLVNVAKLAQTITCAAPAAKRANDPAFALSATASSGLPVSLAIVSGPAMLAGGTVTLTGSAGTVTVRASQPGDTVYAPAPDVTRTFEVIPVGPEIYFGSIGGKSMAAQINADGKSGTMIGLLPGTGEGFVVNFTLDASGHWVAAVTTFTGDTTAGVSGDLGRLAALRIDLPGEPKAASATFTRTFRGSVVGRTLSGTVDGLGISFSAALIPSTGPTASISGYYQSSTLSTASGSIYSIVGTAGQVYVLAITPEYVGGNSGTAAVNGTFSVVAGQTTINGSVDAPTTIVEGTLSRPGRPAEAFAGLAVTTLRTDRLLNLSSRARVDGAVSQLITGFVIGGTEPKTVLLRAIGPALGSFGVSGALPGARLRLFDGQGKVLREIDGWRDDPTLAVTFARVGAFALGAALGAANGAANGDAAFVATLAPGAYTMEVVPVAAAGGSAGGVGLAEIYDASLNPHSEYQRLVNISSRGTIESGEGVLIGGFVVAGNSPKRLLVRGVGPALAAFGVASALADPLLTVYDGGAALARNDNWGTPTTVNTAQIAATPEQISAAEAQVGAFRYGAGGRDAAVIVTLAPGAYTAHVAGAAGSTGTALIEIYELPLN